MLRRNRSWCHRALVVAGLLAGLAACGGGGGGSSSSSEADLVVYSRGSMTASRVDIGTTNSFALGGVDYTLRSGGTSCALDARPASAQPAACSPLASGAAFLACDASNALRLVLLRTTDFNEVSWSQVSGRTLTQVTCGATGVQPISGSTVRFSGFPGSAVERHVTDGGATVTEITYGSDNLMRLFSDEGAFGNSTLIRHRWVLYKAAVGSSSFFVLVDAYQGSFPPAPAVYVVQVP